MSEFTKEYIIEIAERTQYNLINYSDDYDVTQLVNSAVGLLIFPHEKYYSKIDDSFVSEDVLNDLRYSIETDTYSEKGKPITLRDIVTHIRNGIAHSRILFSVENKKLSAIKISDHRKKHTYKKDGKTIVVPVADFRIVLSIQTLRQFMMEFSKSIISKGIDKEGK